MNLAHLLLRAARSYPDNPALYRGERLLCNYHGLAARAAAIATYLRTEARLVPGDRVMLFMPNCPEYFELLYGIWWAGLVAVPVNHKLHPKEAEFILQHSGAALVFTAADSFGKAGTSTLPPDRLITVPGAEYLALVNGAPIPVEPRAPEDLAWLFYTSGTTGRPKGVMLTNRNLLTMTSAYFIDVDEVSALDAIVYAAPMSHGAGLYNFAAVAKAARHVVPDSSGFDPAELVQLAQSVGRLFLFAAPTMVKRLTDYVLSSGADVSGFKTIVYGGGPMYLEDIKRALAALGNRFVQIYGQGESPMTITVLPRAVLGDSSGPRRDARLASVGIPHALVEVRVVNQEGQVLPAGETGEVIVRGDTVMAGYWNDTDASGRTLRGGWLWTGDLGCFDEEGFLTLKDRSKDVIISGGSNIYPREIEEVLLMHPAVSEVAVVGRPDPEWGEVVIAFIVGSADPAELDSLCLQHIARFKRPKEYHFVSSLPKNNYGKVLKKDLRQSLSQPVQN